MHTPNTRERHQESFESPAGNAGVLSRNIFPRGRANPPHSKRTGGGGGGHIPPPFLVPRAIFKCQHYGKTGLSLSCPPLLALPAVTASESNLLSLARSSFVFIYLKMRSFLLLGFSYNLDSDLHYSKRWRET